MLLLENFTIEYFFTSLFSVVYSMSLWLIDIISEATCLANHTLAVLKDLIINIYQILLWFTDIIKEVMLFLSVAGPSLFIILTILLFLIKGFLTLIYIVKAYNNRKEIINFISECLDFFLNCFVWLIKFIIHCPQEAILLLQIICCLLNLSIAITNISLWSFSYSSLIINNMDINTVCKFSSDYNFLASQDTIFTSVISINPGLALNDFAFSGYSIDIFSDYLLMDGNIGGGSSSASNMANSNLSGLPNLPGGGSSSGGQANLTDFDRYITSFWFGDAPKAGQLLPYLFGEEASNSIKQLVALRAISVAENNPWINEIELTNIENKYNSVYRKAFWLYQQEHKLGSFPPVNNDRMMTDLKQLVLLSSCVDNLRLSYGLSPLLGDSYPMERQTIPYSSQVGSIMKLINTEIYATSNVLSQAIERTLPADSQNRIMMSIEGRLPGYISYEEKISVWIEWLTSGMAQITDVDVYDKWMVDDFRARTGLNTSVELPPRAARLASIDHYNKKIFTGDSSYLDNQLRTKAYMINNSPILRELYRGQDVFR